MERIDLEEFAWKVRVRPLTMDDFDALVVDDPETGPRVLTFGGDRETFDFTDPENYLRIDNDVWTFAPPASS